MKSVSPAKTKSICSRRTLLVLVGMALALSAIVGYRRYQDVQRAQLQHADWNEREKVHSQLERTIDLQFDKPVTLEEWATEFTLQSGLKVLASEEFIDPFAGEDSQKFNALSHDPQPFTWQLPTLPARVALDTVCNLRSVSWTLSDDGVVLLYVQQNDERRYAETYQVPNELSLKPAELLNLLTRYVEPDQWDDVGGDWSMQLLPGSFTTVQSYRGHVQTREFLSGLLAAQQQARRTLPTGRDATDPGWEPIWLHGPKERMRALQESLDTPIDLTAVNQPWPEFVRALALQVGVPIVQIKVSEGLPPASVTCELRGVPLRETLSSLGFGDQLSFVALAEGRCLAIRSNEEVGFEAQLVFAYPIGDFAHAQPISEPEDLIDLISSSIDADSWQDVGGPGSIETIAQGQLLIISQTLDNHRRIKDLLTGLRQLQGERLRSLVLEPEIKLPTISPEVQARLRAPLELHYREMLVRDVLADLRERSRISFSELEQTFAARLDQVWCHLPAAPLEDNLRLLWTVCGFDLTDLDHLAQIRTSVLDWDSRDTAPTEVFDLRPRLVGAGRDLRVANLLELVFNPESWESVGGPGHVEQFREFLVVRNQPVIVDRIRDFLSVLNEHVQSTSPKVWRGEPLTGDAFNRPLELYGASDAVRIWRDGLAAKEAALRKKLKQKVNIELLEQTRGEAILAVAREHGLPIVIHAITPPFDPHDQLPALKERDVPLAEVLQRLIGDPETVVWRVQDGCLMIAAPHVERRREARLLYSVDDLLQPRGPLLPGQLLRTIEPRLRKSDEPEGFDYRRYGHHSEISLHLGNLFWLEAYPAQPAQDTVEQALRDLRTGRIKPLPPEKSDLHYYHRPYPHYSGIPVIGSDPAELHNR